jgi:hypothetical protein
MIFFKTVLLLPMAMPLIAARKSFWRGLSSEATDKKCWHTASTLWHAVGCQGLRGGCISVQKLSVHTNLLSIA